MYYSYYHQGPPFVNMNNPQHHDANYDGSHNFGSYQPPYQQGHSYNEYPTPQQNYYPSHQSESSSSYFNPQMANDYGNAPYGNIQYPLGGFNNGLANGIPYGSYNQGLNNQMINHNFHSANLNYSCPNAGLENGYQGQFQYQPRETKSMNNCRVKHAYQNTQAISGDPRFYAEASKPVLGYDNSTGGFTFNLLIPQFDNQNHVQIEDQQTLQLQRYNSPNDNLKVKPPPSNIQNHQTTQDNQPSTSQFANNHPIDETIAHPNSFIFNDTTDQIPFSSDPNTPNRISLCGKVNCHCPMTGDKGAAISDYKTRAWAWLQANRRLDSGNPFDLSTFEPLNREIRDHMSAHQNTLYECEMRHRMNWELWVLKKGMALQNWRHLLKQTFVRDILGSLHCDGCGKKPMSQRKVYLKMMHEEGMYFDGCDHGINKEAVSLLWRTLKNMMEFHPWNMTEEDMGWGRKRWNDGQKLYLMKQQKNPGTCSRFLKDVDIPGVVNTEGGEEGRAIQRTEETGKNDGYDESDMDSLFGEARD